MKPTIRTSGNTSHFHRFRIFILLITWFSLSGNVFAQSESDSLKSPRMIMDPATGELRPRPILVSGVEPTPFKNYIVELGAGLAFPLQDFHSADPANERAGYALQGFSLSTGVFVGFSENSEAGWYFGAAYSGFRKSSDFADSLATAPPIWPPGDGEEQSTFRVNPDHQQRYHIFSLRTGFAFEGSNENVSAFGNVMANMNIISMNRIPLDEIRISGTTPGSYAIGFEPVISSGISAAFGLRFQQQLSVGIAWHYLGSPEMSFLEGPVEGSPPIAFSDFALQRRIHFLEVKLSYGITPRSGARLPWSPRN
ncbi:MAG: hypothetical protein LC670_14525 [Flavobacteriales bacterium]|nr:hypothetical protein [Flavobacteriales bacterium]